jgi:hypothetical protein
MEGTLKPRGQEECKRRYPHLMKALQWSLIGTEGEAACTLSLYTQSIRLGCEAVSHQGGTNLDAIKHAIACYRMRQQVRRECAGYGLQEAA